VLRALAQDSHAGRQVGRLDVGDQAGFEALAQAVVQRVQIAGEAVGREDAARFADNFWKSAIDYGRTTA
jgi:hypothetical protein